MTALRITFHECDRVELMLETTRYISHVNIFPIIVAMFFNVSS